MNHQQIDWPGIRANAVAVGVREAARQAGADLPPIEQARFVERVLKRSARQGWITQKLQIQSANGIPHVSNHGYKPKPMSALVLNAADSIAKHLNALGEQTKLGLVQAAHSAAQKLSEMPGEDVLDNAQEFRHIVAGSAQLHGWEAKAGVTLNVGIQLGKMT